MAPSVHIPNLARTPYGSIPDGFSLERALSFFSPPDSRRLSFDPHVFSGTYAPSDVLYRQGMLSSFLDSSLRPGLDQFARAIPRYIPHALSFEEFSFSDDAQNRVLSDLASVEKMLRIPFALERAAELSGNATGIHDLRRFARNTRQNLTHYERITRPLLAQWEQVEKLDDLDASVTFANQVLDRLVYMRPFFDTFADLKKHFNHYRSLAAPYEWTRGGKTVPFCIPTFREGKDRSGAIVRGYHPAYCATRRVGRFHKDSQLILNVPNDVFWGNTARATYLHGPNSQGKSVYQAMVGLNIHLVMNGAFCFAERADLALPRRLFTCFDLGSVAGAGHFEAGGYDIQTMVRKVGKNDIVFIDEVGSGTEPTAERQIARGITDALYQHNITFFAVSHDKGSWMHHHKLPGVRVLRVADYTDRKKKYLVWEGVAPDGYGLEKARRMRIDPDSIRARFARRFGS